MDGLSVPAHGFKLIAGPGNLELCDEIAATLDGPFCKTTVNRFAGGEIFVPMIPSVRIPDLAAAMAPNLPIKVIGIRPGEKLHEVMCPTDDSHLTLRFHDHFVIKPTIKFFRKDVDYLTNQVGEKGAPVEDGFEYNSGRNDHFLTVDEIREFNRIAVQ